MKPTNEKHQRALAITEMSGRSLLAEATQQPSALSMQDSMTSFSSRNLVGVWVGQYRPVELPSQ
eukprot:1177828-Prorocentrum_minimum.AAC.2